MNNLTFLAIADWQARSETHRQRARVHTLPARQRKDRGEPHPIADFLFEYYPFSFSFLETWHPGLGTAIEWTSGIHPEACVFPLRWHALRDGFLIAEPAHLTEKEWNRLTWIRNLLEATRNRPPNYACHGLHEWAMVFRGRSVRHEKTLKLRLPQQEIDDLVATRPLCCTHHDAFRFFAPETRPMNHLQPDLESRIMLEQPGCIHANMDLYKWAAKSMPWVGSDLLLDCFELAMELRDLDMRASPYDLSNWGHEPVKIETAGGRKQYEDLQKNLTAKARPLRDRLVESIKLTLALSARSQVPDTIL